MDLPLEGKIRTDWTNLKKDIIKATQITFPRHYFTESNNLDDLELHVFVDASVKAYRVAAYVCKRRQSSIVMA